MSFRYDPSDPRPEHVQRKRHDAAVKAAETRRRKKAGIVSGTARARLQSAFGNAPATTPTPAPAPTPTPAPTPAAPTRSAAAGIASRLRPLGSTPEERKRTAAEPSKPDPDAELKMALAASAELLKPTWEVDGKWLRVSMPNALKKISLPIAPKPGPYTPQEQIHDVLGMPEMLYAIAHAIDQQEHLLLEGPTGTAKTTAIRKFGQILNWNVITMPCSRGLEEADMVGEFLPTESDGGGKFAWAYGPVAIAVLASQAHPTILVFEELNRVGNIQVFARIYPLLDDTRMLELQKHDKRQPAPKARNAKGPDGNGHVEVLRPGEHFYVAATANPADSDAADYLGVQELDPALSRRFAVQPKIGYPPEPVEAEALRRRVKGLSGNDALRMVRCATRVRVAEENRFPFSFPDLVAWAKALPYYGWEAAAEIAVVKKARPDEQAGIRDLVRARPTAAGV